MQSVNGKTDFNRKPTILRINKTKKLVQNFSSHLTLIIFQHIVHTYVISRIAHQIATFPKTPSINANFATPHLYIHTYVQDVTQSKFTIHPYGYVRRYSTTDINSKHQQLQSTHTVAIRRNSKCDGWLPSGGAF